MSLFYIISLSYRIGIPIVRIISPLVGIRWEITGSEILAKDFPCVIISNHQSAWDFMAICELWPVMRKCACVAKRAILYVFPFGFSAWLCGTVYINRKDAKDSRTKISASAEQIQKNKVMMMISSFMKVVEKK
jgi:lysophosphatidate acyltransferase